MEITAQMLREAYRQTQREILAIEAPERYSRRWERMAELLNEKLASDKKPFPETVEELSKESEAN